MLWLEPGSGVPAIHCHTSPWPWIIDCPQCPLLSVSSPRGTPVKTTPALLTHRPHGLPHFFLCQSIRAQPRSKSAVHLEVLHLWFLSLLTCTTPPFQLIQKLRNSSQDRIPGVGTLTRGSPILPAEIQERVFCLPPSTISSISTLSWGLAERAKWASLCVFTATRNWFILLGFFTYWYSYLLGVEIWILSEKWNAK